MNKLIENFNPIMEPDWDLHAVVRGFAAINKSETTAAASAFTADVDHSRRSGAEASYYTGVKQTEVEKHHCFCSTNLAVAEEFRELCTPTCLLDRRQTQFVQPTISSYLAALQAYKKRTQQQTKGSHLYGTTSASSAATTTQTTPKPKRRKNHQKKICHVPAEALSSDVWSWRKYGQKPIKGSPYPRSYYKCSSSKACLARKQVERNRSDPNMFIVTYTAEHNHPAPTHKNSLAGTTRNPNLLSSLSAIAHDESNFPTSKPSSTNSTATMSPEGSLGDEVLQQSKETESMDVDTGGDMNRTNMVDDVMEFWDMDVSENFLGDLDDISGPSMDCFFPDEFLPSFPWDS